MNRVTVVGAAHILGNTQEIPQGCLLQMPSSNEAMLLPEVALILHKDIFF